MSLLFSFPLLLLSLVNFFEYNSLKYPIEEKRKKEAKKEKLVVIIIIFLKREKKEIYKERKERKKSYSNVLNLLYNFMPKIMDKTEVK
jgi:hypothetical protein